MNTAPTMKLRDPARNTRAILDGPADPERLLRAAWGLDQADMIGVVALDNDRWALAIMRREDGFALQVLDIECGHVPDAWIKGNRAGMVEAAWLDLVDDGWTVEP